MRLAVLGDTQYMPPADDALDREARGVALRLLLPALAATQEALPEGYCRSVCNATLEPLPGIVGTAVVLS